MRKLLITLVTMFVVYRRAHAFVNINTATQAELRDSSRHLSRESQSDH